MPIDVEFYIFLKPILKYNPLFSINKVRHYDAAKVACNFAYR